MDYYIFSFLDSRLLFSPVFWHLSYMLEVKTHGWAMCSYKLRRYEFDNHQRFWNYVYTVVTTSSLSPFQWAELRHVSIGFYMIFAFIWWFFRYLTYSAKLLFLSRCFICEHFLFLSFHLWKFTHLRHLKDKEYFDIQTKILRLGLLNLSTTFLCGVVWVVSLSCRSLKQLSEIFSLSITAFLLQSLMQLKKVWLTLHLWPAWPPATRWPR